RHRPRRSSHPRTGTLSRFAISAPQRGHRDRGDTTETPAGTRSVTTVMKLPRARPNGKATIAGSQATCEPYRRRAGRLDVQLLPERALVRGPEPEHPLDPGVVQDVVAVLQVHAPRVQRALTRLLARRVVLPGELPGRV